MREQTLVCYVDHLAEGIHQDFLVIFEIVISSRVLKIVNVCDRVVHIFSVAT